MVEHLGNPAGASPIRSASAAKPAAPARTSPSSAPTGPAFQALLEQLENQARELEAQTQSIANPKDLAGAVDRAHVSLQDALSLSDRLIEAYRAALANPQAAEKHGSAPISRGGA